MANLAGRLIMKGLTIAVSIPVTKAVTKGVESAWTAARSPETPRKPKEPGVRWADAVGWAALSATGIVVAELLTRRTAEGAWRIVMGNEPPAPKKSKAQLKAEKKLEKAQDALTPLS
jgi:hypothetical protein